jgi:hypothetical protein
MASDQEKIHQLIEVNKGLQRVILVLTNQFMAQAGEHSDITKLKYYVESA